MKNYKNRLRAFSLAEALITLLIVCLITLASIPVLTKKKRDKSTHANGMWMCTLRSDEQYVVYNSASPKGKVDDPETWDLSQGGAGCTFVPPLNAKNFVVTAIGGGGAGRDGKSARSEDYLSLSNTYYTPEKDGVYYLAVIGAGGGGAGSDDDKTGGSGGSGAYWIGKVNLKSGQTYISTNGKGAVGKKDGDTCAEYGDYGGSSTFGISGKTYITASGGRGGRSTCYKLIGGHYGGQGGHGGTLTLEDSFNSAFNAKFKLKNNGTRGLGKSTIKTTGVSISSDFWGNDAVPTNNGYGGGGKDGYQGEKGGDGGVFLWEIIQTAGEGGKAATPESVNIPTIPNKAVVTIGLGGKDNSDGNTTKVEIYDIQSNVIRVVQGYGGKAGSEMPNNNYEDTATSLDEAVATLGTSGQASLFNNKPGGVTGNCVASQMTPSDNGDGEELVRKQDESGEPICKYWYYDIGKYVQPSYTTSGIPVNPIKECPLTKLEIGTDNKKGVCVGYTVSGQSKYEDIIKKIRDEEYAESRKSLLMLSQEIFSSYNEGDVQKWETAEQEPSESTLGCLVYETEYIQDQSGTSSSTEAQGPDATAGSSFGAGGGGGCTTNVVGVSGKGGAGAPGAVIIEW